MSADVTVKVVRHQAPESTEYTYVVRRSAQRVVSVEASYKRRSESGREWLESVVILQPGAARIRMSPADGKELVGIMAQVLWGDHPAKNPENTEYHVGVSTVERPDAEE